MSDLKTLKDITELVLMKKGHDKKAVFTDELKQEAIKWAKVIQDMEHNELRGYTSLEFIEEFFNITEEDLE